MSGPESGSFEPALVERLADRRQARPDGKRLVRRGLPPGKSAPGSLLMHSHLMHV